MSRASIRPQDRFEILQRDGFTCRYCGCQPPATELQIDHMVPVCKGGTNSLLNLITSCRLCNAGKNTKTADRVPIPLETIMATRDLAEAEREMAKAIKALVKAKKSKVQAVVELIATSWGESYANISNTNHVMGLVDEFGPELVDQWMSSAFRKNITETAMIQYVYGCARTHRKTEVRDGNA